MFCLRIGEQFIFLVFFGAITSGIINNIPASISLSTAFQTLLAGGETLIVKGAAYGLVIGTNIGSLFTPVGALATILWLSIMRKKGFVFPLKKFIPLGIITGLVSIMIASSVMGVILLALYS